MNKEEIRKARLRALGIEEENSNAATSPDPESRRAEKRERTDMSVAMDTATAAPGVDRVGGDAFELRPDVVQSLTDLLISSSTLEEDMARWFSQGCQFIEHPNYCLMQTHGGPCGVLAAVEAEMVKSIYFGDHREAGACGQLIVHLPPERVRFHFVNALYNIFKRAMTGDRILMVFCNPEDVTTGMWPRHMEVQPISSAVNFERFVIDHFSLYKSMSGCILLTLSLVLTRGIEAVASDMDDSGNGLIGNFGHCNQELVNLLLSGRAVSNVFDGTRPMGDSGLVLKGIHERNDVGYLTHLESMRFCQVGSFYKVPKYPVWVVGSSSHFTVLFSLHEQVNAETEDEMLLTRVKREFRQADYEENGYIPVQRLSGVLISLGINVENMSIEAFNGLKLLLDPESCGIILFGVFWSVVSQLMSGETIDHLLEKFSSRNIITDSTAMITDEISAHQQRERSDSEMARALQDEWNYSSPGSHANIVPASSPRPQASIQHSDSDLARALQDEWNSGSSIEPPHPHHTPVFSSTPVGGLDIMSIISAVSTPPVASVPVASQPHVSLALPSSASKQQDCVADKKFEKFIMYHYNGLSTAASAPQLVSFEMQKRESSNDVGLQISMDTNFGSAFGGGSADFEELLRTRWPDCKISWSGEPPRLD